jgi:hypothetical protein
MKSPRLEPVASPDINLILDKGYFYLLKFVQDIPKQTHTLNISISPRIIFPVDAFLNWGLY